MGTPRPSRWQIRQAHRWLCSVNMEHRRQVRIIPPDSSRFMVDYLPPDKRKEFLERGTLSWQDWNTSWVFLQDPSKRYISRI